MSDLELALCAVFFLFIIGVVLITAYALILANQGEGQMMNWPNRWLCKHGYHKWFRKADWSYTMLKCSRCNRWWPIENKEQTK